MLKQRMITAAWLAPLTLIGLFRLQGGAFALFKDVYCAARCLGVDQLSRSSARQGVRYALVAIMAVLMLAMWLGGAAFAASPLWLAAVGWGINLYWVTHYPDTALQWQATSRRLLMGVWVLLPCWVGFNVLRDSGAVWLLFVLLLVWTADIGAYFAGRR